MTSSYDRAMMATDPLLVRAIPAPDPLTDFFWTSGADGRLRFLRCADCGFYIHPASRPCPRCLSADVAPTVVSGVGIVATFTINIHQWVPRQDPYVIAVIELIEQSGLRLTSNVIGCDPSSVRIGHKVHVRFIHRNDLYYPIFVHAEQSETTA
jgi:uncharacterized OB-fold protein